MHSSLHPKPNQADGNKMFIGLLSKVQTVGSPLTSRTNKNKFFRCLLVRFDELTKVEKSY